MSKILETRVSGEGQDLNLQNVAPVYGAFPGNPP